MTRFAFVAIVALSTAPLFAGVRIQTENTDLSTKKVSTDTILLDSDRMRIDSDDGRSVLFLTDGGRDRMVMLDKTKNTYQEIDEQMMKQMGEQIFSGAASVHPFRKGSLTACAYCDYRAICRFDPWTQSYRVLRRKEEATEE